MADDEENQNQTLINKKDEFSHTLSEKLTNPVYKYTSILESKRHKKCKEVRFFKLPNIIISLLLSLSFYFLLITLLIKLEREYLILFIIVFLVGHFTQYQIIPNFKSEKEFYQKLQDILDSKVSIKSDNKINYYTYNVINELYIPKKIKTVKFGELILYIDEALKEKKDEIKNNFSLKKSEDDIDINYLDEIYFLTDLNSSVKCITIILSLLLLQWIQALYYYLNWKMAIIYPMKLTVSKEFKDEDKPKYVINIHGKKILQPENKEKTNDGTPINNSNNESIIK